jgi:hypothetical protein
MRWPNLQEGKRRARRLAETLDSRDPMWPAALVGSKTEQIYVRTRKPCSCWMGCGNPRHWEKGRERKRTRQERKLPKEEDY